MPIPDALHTMREFMERLENALSTRGYWSSPSSPNNGGDPEREDLASSAHGLPTPEALIIILRQAEQLLSGHTVAALSHIAERLEVHGGVTDPIIRNQIQTEAGQVGLTMQHLGSLFLELGRTILTLRMGQSPAQSLVHPGPAVYISPSGPNPLMVQPFPVQTSLLFSGPASPQPMSGMMGGSVGSGGSQRNVNINAPTIGVPNSDSESVTSTTVQPPSSSNSSQESLIDSASLHAIVSRLNAHIRNHIGRQGEDQVQSGQSEDPASPNLPENVVNHQNVAVNVTEEEQQAKGERDEGATGVRNKSNEAPSTSENVPLGLGGGGLQPKRKTTKQVKDASRATTSCSIEQSFGRQVLQSLASHGSDPSTRNANNAQAHQVHSQAEQSQAQAQDLLSGQIGTAGSLLEILNSPDLSSWLTEMSQEAGMGSSPDGLRSMLSQIIQRSELTNTFHQFGQQIQENLTDPERIGFELSRMVQQVRPFIAEALVESELGSAPAREPSFTPDPEPNIELQWSQQVDMFEQIVERVQRDDPPQEIFGIVLDFVRSLLSTGDLMRLCIGPVN